MRCACPGARIDLSLTEAKPSELGAHGVSVLEPRFAANPGEPFGPLARLPPVVSAPGYWWRCVARASKPVAKPSLRRELTQGSAVPRRRPSPRACGARPILDRSFA